jgi:hypothetical protein
VVVGVICHPPFLRRASCRPILARLWIPGERDHIPLVWPASWLTWSLRMSATAVWTWSATPPTSASPCKARPGHRDARLRCDAALYQPAPPPTGRCGRLRVKGDRQPELMVLAGMTRYRWTPVTLRCYGQTLQREVLAIGCLWYGALNAQPVQVVLSRPVGAPDGYELALATTDLATTPAQVIERYSHRWAAETAFLDSRHLAGVGQARTRTQRSVERLIPFVLVGVSLAIVWYARHGHPAADLAAHRARAPWYRTKRTVSVADMLAALRRALLAAQYRQGQLDQHILDLFPAALVTDLDPAA